MIDWEKSELLIDVACSWIGTPFFHQARQKGIGTDCLGLVLGVWQEALNEPFVEDFNYAPPPNFKVHRNINFKKFRSLVVNISPIYLQHGDVICFDLSKDHWHLGFYRVHQGHEFLIHARSKIGVVEENYSQFWKSKTHSLFRLTEV